MPLHIIRELQKVQPHSAKLERLVSRHSPLLRKARVAEKLRAPKFIHGHGHGFNLRRENFNRATTFHSASNARTPLALSHVEGRWQSFYRPSSFRLPRSLRPDRATRSIARASQRPLPSARYRGPARTRRTCRGPIRAHSRATSTAAPLADLGPLVCQFCKGSLQFLNLRHDI